MMPLRGYVLSHAPFDHSELALLPGTVAVHGRRPVKPDMMKAGSGNGATMWYSGPRRGKCSPRHMAGKWADRRNRNYSLISERLGQMLRVESLIKAHITLRGGRGPKQACNCHFIPCVGSPASPLILAAAYPMMANRSLSQDSNPQPHGRKLLVSPRKNPRSGCPAFIFPRDPAPRQ